MRGCRRARIRHPTAYAPGDLDKWAARAKLWAEGGQPDDLPLADPASKPEKQPRDVFVYIIHEGKLRAPQGAMAFMERIQKGIVWGRKV